jgi:hypothetical protein
MSPIDTTKNTKEKILEEANKLFASNGFSGTSIREIATQADVNIAAVNYHFKSKENLYWEVFEFNYSLIENEIAKIGQQNIPTPEFAVEVYNFFATSGSPIMQIFKVFLSESVPRPEDMNTEEYTNRFGPPGHKTFLDKIGKDLGNSVSIEGQIWAVKMIFSLIVHFGVIMNTSIMKEKCKKEKDLKPEFIKKNLLHSARAHLNYLKENPDLFS